MIVGYVLFILAGFAFGYAAPGMWKWAPLVFPLLLGIAAMLKDGITADVLVKLIIALLLTAGGIVLGALVDERSKRREAAEAG